jgi:hypothetical protein
MCELAKMPCRPAIRSAEEVTIIETCPEGEGSPPHVTIICGLGGCRETILSCDFCGDMGIVEIEVADRWRKGRALRDETVKARLSPAEGAAIRGLTVFQQNERMVAQKCQSACSAGSPGPRPIAQ